MLAFSRRPGPTWLPSPWSRRPQVSRAAGPPRSPLPGLIAPFGFAGRRFAPRAPFRAAVGRVRGRGAARGASEVAAVWLFPSRRCPRSSGLLRGLGLGPVPCSRRLTCRGQSGGRRARVGDGRSRRDKRLPLRLNQAAAALALRD